MELLCPDDGSKCPFFRAAASNRSGFIKMPKHWGFLIDFSTETKRIHFPPKCMNKDRNDLCDGSIPTCESFRGVSEQQQRQGYRPYGCRDYHNCQNKWITVTTFPPCIEREIALIMDNPSGIRAPHPNRWWRAERGA